MEYTQYTTQENDRWDTIAYKAYGDAGRIDGLIKANPGLAAGRVLPAGVTIRVPVAAAAVAADNPLLPPWKRGQ